MNRESDVGSAVQDLRARGYRLTPQRLAILRLVRESTAHPCAEDLFQLLGRSSLA